MKAGASGASVPYTSSVETCKKQKAALSGHAELMAGISRTIDQVDPWLTLDGLRLIHERASGKKALP